MKYLLDTNVCIRYLNGQSDGIRQMLEGASPSQIALCSIVRAELLAGKFLDGDTVRVDANAFGFVFEKANRS